MGGYNIGYPSETPPPLKCHETLFAHNIRFSYPIVLEWYTEYDSISHSLCTLWTNISSWISHKTAGEDLVLSGSIHGTGQQWESLYTSFDNKILNIKSISTSCSPTWSFDITNRGSVDPISQIICAATENICKYITYPTHLLCVYIYKSIMFQPVYLPSVCITTIPISRAPIRRLQH